MNDRAATEVVSSDQPLAELISRARARGVIGLDTEFMREKTYRARLCLIQISTDGEIYLIDPLERQDLEEVAGLISDPDVEVLVHAGRQDFEIFFERYDVVPTRVFDVQLAAGFAGLGASLPYGRLVESITGKALTKGESYTDWCRRPLTDAQLKYAADDVRYLHAIAGVLKDKLGVSGRLEWAHAEMEAFEQRSLYELDPQDAYKKVSGRGNLSGKQMAVLRALAAWREETAQRRDIPRGWVIKDQTLIELARRAPRSEKELKGIRGLGEREAERSARALLEAVEAGQGSPPVAVGPGPSRTAQVRARTLSGLADAIIRSRCEAEGIAPELVGTRAELESLLADVFDGGPHESRHRLLQSWRRDLAGAAIVDLARGKIAVRSIDHPPYVEEVSL